jgi:hypothetical protein
MLLPIAVVAAPFVAAADAVVVSAGTTQPLNVVSASGTKLAGPKSPEAKAAGTFTTVAGTIQCSGTAQGAPGWLEAVKVPVRCTNGMRGLASVEGNLSSGYNLKMTVAKGETRGMLCQGFFAAKGASAGPFLIECAHQRSEWVDFNKTKRQMAVFGHSKSAGIAGPVTGGAFTVKTWVAPL